MAVVQSQATVVPKSIKYEIMTLNLFPTSGCQFANPLSFSLYLRHSFCSESKFVKENSIVYENQTVKLCKSFTKIQILQKIFIMPTTKGKEKESTQQMIPHPPKFTKTFTTKFATHLHLFITIY